MPVILFGNVGTIERTTNDDGSVTVDNHPHTITSYGPPDEWDAAEILNTFTSANGAWEWHSTEKPVWVECEADPFMAEMFARHYGCPVGRPDDWDDIVAESRGEEVAPKASKKAAK